LLGLLAKLDRDPSPADWMVAGPERDGFRNSIVLLVALLHLAWGWRGTRSLVCNRGAAVCGLGEGR
jgi:hypothetical protein